MMDIEKIKSEFQFIASTITNISVKNNFVVLPEYEELKLKMDTEYEIKAIYFDDGINGVLSLKTLAEAKKGKQKISISITIEGLFTDINEDKEHFISLLKLNGCATLYSIARAQIIGLSAQSLASGHLILPMVNFFKAKELKDKKKQSEQK